LGATVGARPPCTAANSDVVLISNRTAASARTLQFLVCWHNVRVVCWIILQSIGTGEHAMAKARSGLDGRHRDKSGRIEKKHGNTRVAALRKEYGPGFAKGHRKDMMLKTLLKKTGSESLHEYLRHHHR
jgi:hypothetical protein